MQPTIKLCSTVVLCTTLANIEGSEHKGSKPVFANFRENRVKSFSTLNPLFCALDGVFSRSVYFGMGSAQLFKSAHMHPRKNHTLSTRKIVII